MPVFIISPPPSSLLGLSHHIYLADALTAASTPALLTFGADNSCSCRRKGLSRVSSDIQHLLDSRNSSPFLPSHDDQKCLQKPPNVRWGERQNHPQLRITVLGERPHPHTHMLRSSNLLLLTVLLKERNSRPSLLDSNTKLNSICSEGYG